VFENFGGFIVSLADAENAPSNGLSIPTSNASLAHKLFTNHVTLLSFLQLKVSSNETRMNEIVASRTPQIF
jgi:hypothetical protein